MRLCLIVSFLSVVLFSYGQSKIDVLHYRYEIELNDKNDTIYGNAKILIKFIAPLKSFTLDLAHPDLSGKGMMVTNISGPSVGNTFVDKDDHKIKIDLRKEMLQHDTASFFISYRGIPANGLIISKNKYGKRTFFGDNWPDRAHHWLPCVEDPADKAAVEFIITAPAHYQVVANGVQVEETNLPYDKKRTHWKEDVPISTKVMTIGVADFAVNLAGFADNCIPVYSWVYPEDRDKGFFDYALASEILPWFIRQVGPYGYKKLANVQSKTTYGGLENANTIFYSESSVTGDRSNESLYVHEVAHQWFGNMTTEKSFAHLWLSEGFASYFTILYMEQKYGKEKAAELLKADRETVLSFSNGKPVINDTPNYMELLNPNSYQKGSWILHMLRQETGDSLFWKCIRNYYAAYSGKTASTEDFQKIIEQTTGKKMNTFFRQWLYTVENPSLKIRWQYLKNEKKVAITVEQEQKGLFEFPLNIYLISGLRKNKAEKLMITKRSETFYVQAPPEIAQIDADYNTSLLAKIAVSQIQ